MYRPEGLIASINVRHITNELISKKFLNGEEREKERARASTERKGKGGGGRGEAGANEPGRNYRPWLISRRAYDGLREK